jgi:glycosyltransferase involved in cell wall biosynthesis
MSVLYLLTFPEPVLEGTDAVWQDVEALQKAFGGTRINLFPFKKPTKFLHVSLYGLHRIKSVRSQENNQLKINHIFVPTLHYLPLFYFMKNPIVYTVGASLQKQKKPLNIDRLNRLHRIVISNERDRQILESWGIKNYSIITPGIDSSGFSPYPLPLEKELILLMASAPWDKAQFYSKGVDLLLETAAELPYLKLILIWRGHLHEELLKKIRHHGVRRKVEVINEKVNVNDYLKKVHATILLAKHPKLVKSFPHSLIESLAAGKPVIVSNTIPMADYVTEHRCGVVVEELQIESLAESISLLMNQYKSAADQARRIRAQDFSLEQMIHQYRRLYRSEI